MSLAYFLGVPLEEINRISDPVPSAVDPRQTVNFEELATQTPEHQQILATIDANLAGIGIARSGFFPSLNLTGTVGRNGPDFFPDQSDRWSVGASITIPLFDGGRDVSAVQAATATRNSSLSHRVTVDQDTVTSLKQAYQKYLESIEKLKVDETFQKAALVRAEVARSQYNNGLISFTDWDQIENDLITRQKSYLQSKKDRVLSESAWKQAQGQGVLP
jgi:outer membrane protein TolC